MKILVVGGGGREHAIIWKLNQSPKISKIYCAPGNGGISDLAECVDILATDINQMIDFAQREKVELVIVGPDDPLALGMVDAMEQVGIKAFGPSKAAAAIEGSKVFSKDLMKKYGIPTAQYEVFDDYEQAVNYLDIASYPLVVKADGLALGKGVIIANSYDEAKLALKEMMVDKVFGQAGSQVVLEEFLTGPEVSILAFTDGITVIPMVSSQDHKRAYDGDRGPNTGGMGTFSPSRVYTSDIAGIVEKTIFKPTVDAMNQEGRPFKGILFFGLMLTQEGPKVLEYNARFGDPETQVVLPRLKTDLLDILMAVVDERLDEIEIEWDDGAAVCVILASGGYPNAYNKDYIINGLQEMKEDPNIIVFHAGTRKKDGNFFTHGGRVLGVTALGEDLDKATYRAYDGVEKIDFKDMHYRKDIGKK